MSNNTATYDMDLLQIQFIQCWTILSYVTCTTNTNYHLNFSDYFIFKLHG